MNPTYEAVISGERRGIAAFCARGLLAGLSVAYAPIIGLRNAWYNLGWGVWRLPVPVISVGNITVGGTGKTPMAAWLCRHLADRGGRPAVVARGYKAKKGKRPDELAMLERHCREAGFVAYRDRVAGAFLAAEKLGARTIILDDGFQHRRLARDLDIVLIDATRPFGYERLIPRGLLRESLRSLCRADLLVITRANQVEPAELASLRDALGRLAPGKPILGAVHRPGGFHKLDGRPVPTPDTGRRVFLFAGIARPAAFQQTVRRLGFAPVGSRWYSDHYDYRPADVPSLVTAAREARADLLLTTEKDAVKLAALRTDWPMRVLALHVEIEFLDDGATIMAAAVDRVVSGTEKRHA